MKNLEKILILDFGSQYTQLIARRIREENVYSEIVPFNISLNKIKEINPSGLILSGGPRSVYDDNAPHPDKSIFSLGIPILGICYGIQLIAELLNGKVSPAKNREYGKTIFTVNSNSILFKDVQKTSSVWMSHGDLITAIPERFEIIGVSENSPFCAIENLSDKIFGVQFHPEVSHTLEGKKILNNFLFDICKCTGDWNSQNIISTSILEIQEKTKDKKVICALSGGVDSSVAAVLVHKAIGDNLTCIHVDSGLMRKDESDRVVKMFNDDFNMKIIHIKAEERFLKNLEGVTDPEKKRKIIGETFIKVFEEEASKILGAEYLVQGTLYPDVIESSAFNGASKTIKTHHNVGGLPENMNLKLIEPFRELFKDEVRLIGYDLNIPENFIKRHPFPGPGLAVRILGEVTKEKSDLLREVDNIFIEEIITAGIYDDIWQAFAVLLPVQTVGVMGDSRTYENVIALRAVISIDGMTADWFRFDHDFLEKVSSRITREIKGVNRVVYDISSKPPSTIEWE